MNVELMIHILLVLILVGLTFMVGIVVMIIRDLSEIVHTLEKIYLDHCKARDQKAKTENSIKEMLSSLVMKGMEDKAKINVVDKPLDFPNEEK